MAGLGQAQIIGATIRRLLQENRPQRRDGWLDYACTYFVLELGGSFMLPPSVFADLGGETVPPAAAPVPQEVGRRIIGQRIAEVLRVLHDGRPCDEPAVLKLSSGLYVTEVPVAPHGTGGAGLDVYSVAEWSEQCARRGTETVSFWRELPGLAPAPKLP